MMVSSRRPALAKIGSGLWPDAMVASKKTLKVQHLRGEGLRVKHHLYSHLPCCCRMQYLELCIQNSMSCQAC